MVLTLIRILNDFIILTLFNLVLMNETCFEKHLKHCN